MDAPRRGVWSIGTRLRVATVVFVALLGVMVVGAVIQVGLPSFKLYVIGSGVRQVSISAVPALASLQTERQQALGYLAARTGTTTRLRQQEARTDRGLRSMRSAAAAALSGAPQEITQRLDTFTQLLRQLPGERSRIADRQVSSAAVYAFYNRVLDAATRLFDAQARVVPDAGITQSAIAAVALFRDSDDMSRAGSLASGALTAGTFTRQNFQQFQYLVGAYHTDLAETEPYLQPAAQAAYRSIVDSQPFRRLTAVENAFVARGPDVPPPPADSDGPDSGGRQAFPVGQGEWSSLTAAVSGQLIGLTVQQANLIAAEAADVGHAQWIRTLVVLLAVLLAAAGAAVLGLRLAWSVSRRLDNLAAGVHSMATEQAPELTRRIQGGEDVDVDAAVALLDAGRDEIGDVARRFKDAAVADIAAQSREIRLRQGSTRVLMELARRMQLPITRLFEILDAAQAHEADEEVVALLYRIDHMVVRARRTADHMIVLAGGELPRQRIGGVSLYDIVRGAATETSSLERFVYENVPDDVTVAPRAAQQLAHIVSELMDNAVKYSPTDSTVRVSAERTGRGVAIEIADMGRGLDNETLDALNVLMRDPPAFDAMAPGDAINQLGLFVVARLAHGLGVMVAFRVSAFQGLSAVVSVPTDLLLGGVPPADQAPGGSAGPEWAVTAGTLTWPRRDTRYAGVATASTTTPGLLPVGAQPTFAGPRHSRPPEPAAEPAEHVRPPLPKRRRGASLQDRNAGSLAVVAAATPVDTFDDERVTRSATQLTALQRGTIRGRQAADTVDERGYDWPDEEESRSR